MVDDQFEAVAGAVLGPGGPGACVVIGEGNFASAGELPDASADWVIVRDWLPSRLALLHWRDLAAQILRVLRPGGRLVFDYLDRTRIERPRDIVPGAEYHTPDLAARLLARVGFARSEHLGSSERASFTRATKGG
jgi:predicted methyltransferase